MALRTNIAFDATGVPQTVGQINRVNAAVDQSGKEVSKFGQSGKSLGDVAFGFNNIIGAVLNLKAALAPAYDLLIGQNERLNQQLLSSQANIAATSRLFKDGVEITDPTEKVQASQESLKAALAELERKTVDLVGVTSAQVNEVFQITLQNAADLTGQSVEFSDSISASTELTRGLVATMGTLGVPLDQARQEINSIIKGQITSDSILAKSLGITNQQVNQWKSQGVLVDQLNSKFETFVAGNKLAADSITGITSNLQDVLEITAREAGKPLMEPLINSLREMYGFLQNNQEAIQQFAQDAILKFMALAEAVSNAATEILTALAPSFDSLKEAGPVAVNLLIDGFTSLANLVGFLGKIIAPVINLLSKAVETGVNVLRRAQTVVAFFTGGLKDSRDAVKSYGAATDSLLTQASDKEGKLKAAIEATQEARENDKELREVQ